MISKISMLWRVKVLFFCLTFGLGIRTNPKTWCIMRCAVSKSCLHIVCLLLEAMLLLNFARQLSNSKSNYSWPWIIVHHMFTWFDTGNHGYRICNTWTKQRVVSWDWLLVLPFSRMNRFKTVRCKVLWNGFLTKKWKELAGDMLLGHGRIFHLKILSLCNWNSK